MIKKTLHHKEVKPHIRAFIVSLLAISCTFAVSSELNAAPGDSYQLGAFGNFLPGGGFQLIQTNALGPTVPVSTPFGPALLTPGDTIFEINGVRFWGKGQYDQLLNASQGRDVMLSVIDGRTGAVLRCVARPRLVRRKAPIDDFVPPVPPRDQNAPSPPRAPSQPPPQQERRTKIILIGLTDDPSLRQSIRMSMGYMRTLFRGIPGSDLIELKGPEANGHRIIETVRRMRVNPSDALVCYYLGHGAFDDSLQFGASRGHYLDMGATKLFRQDLLSEIKKKNARLSVLMTDSCNVRLELAGGNGLVIPTMIGKAQLGLANLFDNHRGVVDLNSSSSGEYAWFDRAIGGWFTAAFFDVAQRHSGNQALSWYEFLTGVAAETRQNFLRGQNLARRFPVGSDPNLLRQAQQTPYMFENQLQATFVRVQR